MFDGVMIRAMLGSSLFKKGNQNILHKQRRPIKNKKQRFHTMLLSRIQVP
jgi:hypothetical protein